MSGIGRPGLSGQRVVVTGASGLMGLPLALALAADNEVTAVARFRDPASRRRLEDAGATTVAWDLTDPDLSPLPASADVVFHCGAMTGEADGVGWSGPARPVQGRTRAAFESNAQATGRLMMRYRDCRGFLHCSSASAYAYQRQRPLREDDPYGLHNSLEVYAASKIAGESLVEFLSREFAVPAVILRIFSLYGPLGGAPAAQVAMMLRGDPVPVYPGGPNRFNLMFEDDYVEKAVAAVALADVPPLTMNFGGSEVSSVEDYCRLAAGLLGVDARFRETPEMYWPLWADLSLMESLIGATRVPVAEGIRRVVEAATRGSADAGEG